MSTIDTSLNMFRHVVNLLTVSFNNRDKLCPGCKINTAILWVFANQGRQDHEYKFSQWRITGWLFLTLLFLHFLFVGNAGNGFWRKCSCAAHIYSSEWQIVFKQKQALLGFSVKKTFKHLIIWTVNISFLLWNTSVSLRGCCWEDRCLANPPGPDTYWTCIWLC